MKPEKIKKIEKIVRKDLGNGRHLTKKLKERIVKSGYCVENVCIELESLKLIKD